jgi:hypothetical protein
MTTTMPMRCEIKSHHLNLPEHYHRAAADALARLGRLEQPPFSILNSTLQIISMLSIVTQLLKRQCDDDLVSAIGLARPCCWTASYDIMLPTVNHVRYRIFAINNMFV